MRPFTVVEPLELKCNHLSIVLVKRTGELELPHNLEVAHRLVVDLRLVVGHKLKAAHILANLVMRLDRRR